MANRKNPYLGVNAHLNSLLQTPGTDEQPSLWQSFHAMHISDIARLLNTVLPDNYIALTEISLQSKGDAGFGEIVIHRPEPDVTIFQQQPSLIPTQEIRQAQPTWQATIEETIDPEDLPSAVVIRHISQQSVGGKPVVRIELLSPSNKPSGSGYAAYRDRRLEALQSDIPLIEIDYLHETRSPIHHLPLYPHEPKSYPYYIALSNPRPTWRTGVVQAFGFRVNQAMPPILLPLDEDEHLNFDFTPAYQQTFEGGKWATFIRYAVPPVRFETYRTDDQTAIWDVMQIQKGD
jgi:hypothetical protein